MYTYLQKSSLFPNGNKDLSTVDTQNVINIIATKFFLKNWRFGVYKQNFDEIAYLKERCKIFLKYCYPSVIRNLKVSDKWFLFVTDDFIEIVKNELGELDSRVIICDLSTRSFCEEINSYILNGFVPIVTRIDNDDSLSIDYQVMVGKIGKFLSLNNDYGIIIFPNGIQHCISKNETNVMIYNDTHTFSIFYNSLIDLQDKKVPWIFGFPHTQMYLTNYKLFICNTSLPMWSENLNGANQYNAEVKHSLKLDNNQQILSELFPFYK